MPWKGLPPVEPVTSLLGADNRLFVFCPSKLLAPSGDSLPTIGERRRFRETLATLIKCGMRNLYVLPGIDVDMEKLQGDVQSVFFVSDSLVIRHLADGPALVIAPPNAHLESSELHRARQLNEARVFFLSEEFRDPDRLDVRFSEICDGRQLRLEEFLGRVR